MENRLFRMGVNLPQDGECGQVNHLSAVKADLRTKPLLQRDYKDQEIQPGNQGLRVAPGTSSRDHQRRAGQKMEATFLLGLTCLCSPLTALVLDFNTIRGSSEVSSSRKSAQCLTDKDCLSGKYCHKPQEELPFCAPCQGLRRRCQENAMCCPGMICINDVCAQVERMPLAEEQRDGEQADLSAKERLPHPAQAGHVRKEGAGPRPRSPAGAGEHCLRTSDCAQGHCCARHFWAKICKPVLIEGAVCSRRGQKDGGAPGPEIFQRCGCAPGLACQRPLRGAPQRARLRVCRSN